MFTGIVKACIPIQSFEHQQGLATIKLDMSDMLDGLETGASVAVDGVCLTVTEINSGLVSFDMIAETLAVTSLGGCKQGSLVNLERSFQTGAEVGGHIVSGHIDATAEIIDITESENNRTVVYALGKDLMKYVFSKGFVAVNGCSLTVVKADYDAATFSISYIPETLRATNHIHKSIGDRVNIEVERQTQAVVDTVTRLLKDNPEMIKRLLGA